jgi:hypothetical protein
VNQVHYQFNIDQVNYKLSFLFDYIYSFSDFIKAGHIDLDPIVNLDRDLSSSPPLSSPTRNNIKIKNILGLFKQIQNFYHRISFF